MLGSFLWWSFFVFSSGRLWRLHASGKKTWSQNKFSLKKPHCFNFTGKLLFCIEIIIFISIMVVWFPPAPFYHVCQFVTQKNWGWCDRNNLYFLFSFQLIMLSFTGPDMRRVLLWQWREKEMSEKTKALSKLDRQMTSSTMMGSTCTALQDCWPSVSWVWPFERKQGNYRLPAGAFSQTW